MSLKLACADFTLIGTAFLRLGVGEICLREKHGGENDDSGKSFSRMTQHLPAKYKYSDGGEVYQQKVILIAKAIGRQAAESRRSSL